MIEITGDPGPRKAARGSKKAPLIGRVDFTSPLWTARVAYAHCCLAKFFTRLKDRRLGRPAVQCVVVAENRSAANQLSSILSLEKTTK